MCYSAAFNDQKTIRYDPHLLDGEEELFAKICPERPELAGMVTVKEPEDLYYWLDSIKNHALCGLL